MMARSRGCIAASAAFLVSTRYAIAHDGSNGWPSLPEIPLGWELDPGSVILLAITAVLYAIGVARLWRRVGAGHSIRWTECLCYCAGWMAAALALISPLHQWGSTLFAAHMVQHEVLMLIAAPLLILGRPLPVFLWALSRASSRGFSRGLNARPIRAGWHFFTHPFVAWLSHALVLWIWHIPVFFEATLVSPFIHALQHSSFLGSALLFWLALFQGHRRRAGNGMGVMYLFTTALHTGILGALLTFAGQPWYPAYANTAPLWGVSPLEDQQLGGLIMWIPGGVVYIVAGLVLFSDWLREATGRASANELSATATAAKRSA
jgi:putative membrane protein